MLLLMIVMLILIVLIVPVTLSSPTILCKQEILNFTPVARYWFKKNNTGLSEIIVGECIAKSQYEYIQLLQYVCVCMCDIHTCHNVIATCVCILYVYRYLSIYLYISLVLSLSIYIYIERERCIAKPQYESLMVNQACTS